MKMGNPRDDIRIEENIDELVYILTATNDTGLVRRFFSNLFTPAEMADFATRWALVKALSKKNTQREIAKDLGVSLCRITRGSKELKKEDSAFPEMLKKLETKHSGEAV
jgi:TrpR family trp operon transcriptional repressor